MENAQQLIQTAISYAKRSVSAGVPEVNIENTFQAMSILLKMVPLPPDHLQQYETALRAELEIGLAERKQNETRQ